MNQKFFEDYVKKIEDRRSLYKDRLISGGIDSIEEYKYVSGKLIGLNESLQILKELSGSFFGYELEVENGKVYIVR